jgi:hypothetical protein
MKMCDCLALDARFCFPLLLFCSNQLGGRHVLQLGPSLCRAELVRGLSFAVGTVSSKFMDNMPWFI